MISIDREAMASLLAESAEEVLSLSLRVDPSDADNRRSAGSEAWRVWMKTALRDIEQMLPAGREARARWDAVTARLDAVLRDYRPRGKTLVPFIGPGGERRADGGHGAGRTAVAAVAGLRRPDRVRTRSRRRPPARRRWFGRRALLRAGRLSGSVV
jgi:hypothetical protein